MALLLGFSLAEARVHNHTWEITYQHKSLDCYNKLSIAINGMTPGPVLIAMEGDTIIVNVINHLFMENVAIHWHGIRQIGTPWMDGTDGVSQCATMPGDTSTYQFVVDKVTVPAGKSEPFVYDGGDHSIVLSDWYHSSSYEHATDLTYLPYVWIGEPQSLLINGRGKYNCTNLDTSVCNTTNPECVPYSLIAVPGKTYRLRIASLTSLSALSFQIEGHNMTVVEADENYVEPFVTKNLYVYSGEIYSVLVTANQDSRNYWMSTNVVGRKPATPTGLAIFNYYPNHFHKLPPTTPPPGPAWNDTGARINQSLAIKARQGFIQSPPSTSDKVILLLNTQNTIQGRTRDTPYLIALKKNWTDVFNQTPSPESYDIYNIPRNTNSTSSTSIYRLEFNSTVDVILQNANTMNVNDSETHPWHLHGHDFWILGYGDGKFNMSGDVKYNLDNPVMKNTVPLHPYGWTALRFRADNPGIWLCHCHIEAHFLLGMPVMFESGSEMVAEPPQQNMGCGRTKSLIKP
ncbi:hypothetical protein Dsin_016677 [Dipteronia sinensis]|uniref:L-ascorbate oxidase n=1 Tax=Dipteronia sinensis TaxID=43782 RepID=A0AAE0E5Q7_9ROSI|nr:hypothetical protein Dsin_016677 [Dipteronia sinensis]